MLFELKNISKVFLTSEVKTYALSNISFYLKEGEFLSIMGPSGCGKSTLLNILGMLDSPTSGEYLFQGADIANYNEGKLAKVRKNNVGFIFQSFNLIDHLSVRENIALPLFYQGCDKVHVEEQVHSALEKMDLLHRKNHKPTQLSGGQQQRVAIARALVAKPKFILADEPTGNLDSERGREVMELLVDLNNAGTAIIMVTHSEEDAAYGQRIIRLSDGKIIKDEPARIVA